VSITEHLLDVLSAMSVFRILQTVSNRHSCACTDNSANGCACERMADGQADQSATSSSYRAAPRVPFSRVLKGWPEQALIVTAPAIDIAMNTFRNERK
jgi:hypothetical protein